jgi:hypothetical protein
VADIGGDTGSVSNIVESEAGDERIKLHEKGKWLTDTSSSTEDGNLAVGNGLRGIATAEDVG